MAKEIKAGDTFFLDGNDYQVLESPKPELVLFADKDWMQRVPRKGKQVACLKKEVVWNETLKTWTLPGRLLTQDQKNKFAFNNVKMSWGDSVLGVLPRAEDHVEILKKFNDKEL